MDDENTALVAIVPDMAMTLEEAQERMKRFTDYVADQMVKGEDYGVIPGTGDKPTLLKPGAEKICNLFGLGIEAEILDRSIEQWDDPVLLVYHVRTSLRSLRTGQIVASGLGSANSKESKWRYRNAKKTCPACGNTTLRYSTGRTAEESYKGKAEPPNWYCWKKQGVSDGCGATFNEDNPDILRQPSGKVENPDVADQANTILKIAEKRSLINATLKATRASGLFTQDMEEAGGPNKAERAFEGLVAKAQMDEVIEKAKAPVVEPAPRSPVKQGEIIEDYPSVALDALKQRLRKLKEDGGSVSGTLAAAGLTVPVFPDGTADIGSAIRMITRDDIDRVNEYLDQPQVDPESDIPWGD